MNRREFMAGLMAGGILVAGEWWFPGQKTLSIPKIIAPNSVSFSVSGLEVDDMVYFTQIDARGANIKKIYESIRYKIKSNGYLVQDGKVLI